jgi:hypothetical protein
MNLKRIFFFALCASSSSAFAGNTVLPFKNNVKIDAQNKEWHSPLPRYDKNTGINFDIANNDSCLFFILRIADESKQQQILQNGLEVWINMKGKKKKTTGITFPLAQTAAKPGDAPQNGQSKSTDVQKMPSGAPTTGNTQGSRPEGTSDIAFLNGELKLTGFLIDNGKQLSKGCPVKVALAKDASNCLVYELAVPFNTFFKERLEPEDAATKCCIGFIVKAPAAKENASTETDMPEGGMGGPGGGGGGMGGPGGGGGGMGGPGGDMGGGGAMSGQSTTTSDKTFWLKIQLAVQ